MEPVRPGEVHPLLNPLILEIIFRKATLQDLKSFRQVCSTWMLVCSRRMKEVTKIDIFLFEGQSVNPRIASAFVELMSAERSTWLVEPLANTFTLHSGPADIPTFWELFGDQIKSLEMISSSFQSADAMIRVLCESCPNLEHLSLLNVGIRSLNEDNGGGGKLTTPLALSNNSVKTLVCDENVRNKLKIEGIEILKCFPFLQKLYCRRLDFNDDVFRSLARLRNSNRNFWDLKEVSIDFYFLEDPSSIVSALVRTGLKLEGISIMVTESSNEESVNACREIISAHAPTLRKLFYDYLDSDGRFARVCPPNNRTFPMLEMLHLRSSNITSINFLDLAPNLKTMSFTVDLYWEDFDFVGNTRVYHNVKQLVLQFEDSWVFNDFLRYLASKFPSVEKLELVDPTSEQFSLACELWPDVRSLQMVWNSYDLTDAGITGYDEEDMERIRADGSEMPITVRRANISSLRNLESLVWTIDSWPDCSLGECGVLEIPHLKNFGVKKMGYFRDSEELKLYWSKKVLAKFTNATSPSLFNYGEFLLDTQDQ